MIVFSVKIAQILDANVTMNAYSFICSFGWISCFNSLGTGAACTLSGGWGKAAASTLSLVIFCKCIVADNFKLNNKLQLFCFILGNLWFWRVSVEYRSSCHFVNIRKNPSDLFKRPESASGHIFRSHSSSASLLDAVGRSSFDQCSRQKAFK